MHVKFGDSDDEGDEEDDKENQENTKEDGVEEMEVEADPVVNDTAISDLDYLKSRKTSSFLEEEEPKEQDKQEVPTESGVEGKPKDEKDSGTNEKWKTWMKKREDEEEEDLGESGRLFVRNLAFTTTQAELQKLFEKFGTLSEVLVGGCIRQLTQCRFICRLTKQQTKERGLLM